MICYETIDLGESVTPGLRVFRQMRLECFGCKKRFPRAAVTTDGSDWDLEFTRLEIMRKHGFTERIEGRTRRDYCPKCAKKLEAR
jgi:hypothetical protein